MDLQCLLVSLHVPVCEHLAKDISHSAIYRSSETFPFQLNKRFKERASNCSEMSQKGGLGRGYKPVVGVRAFLAEDQTEGSTTAKSDAVFFPHSDSPYHVCSTVTAAHTLDSPCREGKMCSNC